MTKKKEAALAVPEPAAAGEFTPRRFVYCGMRLNKKGERVVVLHLLTDAGQLDRDPDGERWFAFKPARDKHIGGVYEGASFNATQARGLDATRFVGKFEDLGAVAEWTGHDSAAREAIAYEKYRKNQTRVAEVEAFMLPLRKAYDGARARFDTVGMFALERAILKALKTPVRSYEKE